MKKELNTLEKRIESQIAVLQKTRPDWMRPEIDSAVRNLYDARYDFDTLGIDTNMKIEGIDIK